MKKRALITGVTGQDGSYLAELLLDKGYTVFGMVRRASTENFARIEHLREDVTLLQGDLLDANSLEQVLKTSQPDEIYNLAAQSFVPTSWQQPILTGEFTALGVARLLEALRNVCPEARFYQASSSEMFGKVREVPQCENTPFYPRSPYGVAKAFGHYITVNMRESYGLHASSGILFNHESPRRGLEFVTRKITRAAAAIALGLQKQLELGNLDARRDWGFAGDYVDAMWRMLQQDSPGDYVVATGETHSVQEFVNAAFACVNLDPESFVRIRADLIRPAEVDLLVGDPRKAHADLDWSPNVAFQGLVEMMVRSEYDHLWRRASRQPAEGVEGHVDARVGDGWVDARHSRAEADQDQRQRRAERVIAPSEARVPVAQTT